MKKFFILLFLLFSVSSVHAIDKTITCTSVDCSQDSSSPLFNESNIYPGFLTSKELVVNNARLEVCDLNFSAKNTSDPSSILPRQIMISVTSGVTTHYSGSLESLYNSSFHPLGNLGSGVSTPYLFTASFNQAAGNEYQNLKTKFDLNFNFECLNEITPTPTPTSTPVLTSTIASPGSVQGATTINNSNVCNDTAPAGAPTILSLVPGANSVTLNWSEGAGPISYYLIAYGTSSGADQYGNPNIGGPGTTSYTVGSLSPGKTYYFKVRAGNGCTSGLFSNELSGGPSGGVIIPPTEIPSGFQPGVLGEQTQAEYSPSGESDEFLGKTTDYQKKWLPILFLLASMLNLIILRINKNLVSVVLAFGISLVVLLIEILFFKSDRCYITDIFCRYFWIGSILSFLLPLSLVKGRSGEAERD